ncbi:MAG: glycerophosphodiester phosphodiesterase family protein [Desulfobacterales bacterium]|nr:glycerophosphodiester phosphodiesterase family protein [Desulfobacterales bacterium]
MKLSAACRFNKMRKCQSEFLCFAHRGARGHEPENTLRSFSRALELGAPWIELDVFPVEGELVVIHDQRLEGTTSGTGRVTEAPLDYVRSLDAGRGERIPLLQEVFDLVACRAGINIELKWPGCAELLAPLLDRYCRERGWRREHFLVSSFIHEELQRFSRLKPGVRLGALTGELPLRLAAFAQELNAYAVHASIHFLSPGFLEDTHRRGMKFFVYTVNHPDDIARMRRFGADGVFTDYPERVLP